MKNNSITKAIKQISREEGINESEVRMVIEKFIEAMVTSMKKGGLFSIHKFGSFSVRKRAARPGFNIHTGESIEIPEKVTPFFIPANHLKEEIRSKLDPKEVELKRLR